MEENVEREGISLTDIWKIVKKYWVGLVAIIAGTTLIGLLAAFFVVPKSYEAHENLYVMYRDKNSNPDDYMGSGDVTTSIRYVDTIATYLKSSKEHYIATEEALKAQNIEIPYKKLIKGFSFTTGTTSLAISVKYTSRDKTVIPAVLNTFVTTAKAKVKEQFFNNELDVLKNDAEIDASDVNDVSTSKIVVVAASAVVGAVLGLAYEFIANSLDRTVKNKKYIEETFNIKVIGMIPDISKSVGNGSDASDVNEL